MRRFINSLLGRLVCHIAIVALVWPSITLVLLSRVEAQVQTLPLWAVVDFTCAKDSKVGVAAAEAVQSALGRSMSNQADLVPRETVGRTILSMGFQTPVTDLTSLLRLAQELGASTIVTGDVYDFNVTNVGGGKKADVKVRVVIRDVASGLPINGAALAASSSVRTGEADDMTVINEALATAAAQAVFEIKSKTLPTATVLNTLTDTALINQGTRTGFEKGMELIVLRGREQVATARVTDVEPDSAIIKIERSSRGIQPGDRVRAIFEVPEFTGGGPGGGNIKVVKKSRGRPRSDFGTLAMVGLILGVLLSQGRSKNFTAAREVISEAMLFPNFSGDPAVQVKWSRDIFARGNSQLVQWQIYRDDTGVGTAVVVVPGNVSVAVDTIVPRDVTFGDFPHTGGFTCDFSAVPTTTATAVPGVAPGKPYMYSLALVYKIASIDLPGTSTGGGTTGTGGTVGGTTGGTTGGIGGIGGTTGGTTGTATGGTTGAGDCFFISEQQSAKGFATPYNRVGLSSPGPNAVVSTDIPFTFISVENPQFPTTIEYALQISPDPTFPRNRSRIYAKVIRTDLGTLSTGNVDLFNAQSRFIPGLQFNTATQEWFWRIGARNVNDNPGPAPDQSGERYMFGAARRFTIPSPPPPPP